MSGELLIKGKKGQSFNDFVAEWLQLIRCEQWQQRQSGDYADNSYILCSLFSIEITLAIIDDPRFRHFRFLVRFDPEISSRAHKASLAGFADCVARKLAALGYEAIRPFDRQIDGRAIHYQPNPDKDIRPWEKFIAEEVVGMPSEQYSLGLKTGS